MVELHRAAVAVVPQNAVRHEILGAMLARVTKGTALGPAAKRHA